MGEQDLAKPRGPGLPGFAGSFAASSRRAGERDRPHVASRLVVVAGVVALVAAVSVGYGVLSTMGGSDKAEASTQVTATPSERADDKRPSPSDGASEDGGKGRGGSGATGDKAGSVGDSTTKGGSGSDSASSAGPSPASGSKADEKPASDSGSGSSASGSGSGSTSSSGSSSSGTTAKIQGPTAVKAGRVVGFQSHKCIDILDGNTASGTPLQIWDCSDDSWQKWTFYSDRTVRSMGKCMQIAGGSNANGAAVQIATCNGSKAQRFNLNSSNDLVNLGNTSKCVDVKDKKTGNGARLQLWDCSGTANQKWGLG
ncbi:RICIN domain-containing protein [Streptomyces sp. NPDC005483]|uniref:RICIN domain-containing protein n=1 Tax=Streptomyces sp. NPDC005483 TaxID=3154882 RepID=UPI0033AAC590